MNPQPLVRINAANLTTEKLLGECLAAMNAGGRATFLCDSSSGKAVVQRLRMRLSRLRNSMDSKGIAKQHFRLEARVFPYTNKHGSRFDCVVLQKIKTHDHKVIESIEGMMKDAKPSRYAEQAEANADNQHGEHQW